MSKKFYHHLEVDKAEQYYLLKFYYAHHLLQTFRFKLGDKEVKHKINLTIDKWYDKLHTFLRRNGWYYSNKKHEWLKIPKRKRIDDKEDNP